MDLNVGAPYAVGTGTAIDYCGGCDTECPVASVCNVATCTEGVCGTKPDPMQNGKQCTPTTGTNTYGFCESGVCTPVYAFCIIDASGGFFLRVEGGPTNNPSVPQCACAGDNLDSSDQDVPCSACFDGSFNVLGYDVAAACIQ